MGEGNCVPGHQLCRAWRKGREVTGVGGYLHHPVNHIYQALTAQNSTLGEGTEWSLNPTSARARGSLEPLESSESWEVLIRFQLPDSLLMTPRVPTQEPVVEWVLEGPSASSSSWFSCPKCWKLVAREPFEFSLLSCSVLTAQSQGQVACLAVLGAQLRG